MSKGLRYTDKALDEQSVYNLNGNPQYQAAIARYYGDCERRYARYGYWVNKDVPTRNMIKALRMMPWQNSADDWARLHITEAAMRMR